MRVFQLPSTTTANSVLFSADGRHLAVGQPGGVSVFDPLGDAAAVKAFDHTHLGGPDGAHWKVWSATRGGKFLAAWGLRVQRISPGGRVAPVAIAPVGVFNFALSPRGTHAVAGLGDQGNGLRLWYVGNGEEAEHGWDADEQDGTAYPAFGFSPDGSALAVVGRGEAVTPGRRRPATVGNLALHSTKDLERFYMIRLPYTAPERVRWSPVGSRIVVFAAASFAVYDNDRITDPPVRAVNPGRKKVVAEAFHPAGRRMLTASDQSVTVWDTATWQVVNGYRWEVES